MLSITKAIGRWRPYCESTRLQSILQRRCRGRTEPKKRATDRFASEDYEHQHL